MAEPRAQRRNQKPGPMPRGLALGLGIVGILLATPLVLLAFAALLGLGILREAPPLLAALVAGLGILLPAGGLALLLKNRGAGLLMGLPLVSLAILTLLPTYFPGERAEALAAGSGALLQAMGLSPRPLLASRLDADLPALAAGRPPLEKALPDDGLEAPPQRTAALIEVASAGQGDEVLLPYEGEGRSLAVPVVVEGVDGEPQELTMVFDTGATYTTLHPETLRQLGIEVPEDAPVLTFQTAGGERQSRLVLVDRLWVGGLAVEGVTIGVCEDCATEGSAGLLGLNVSRRFLVTVDQARREIGLRPRQDAHDATLDIQPWVSISATATRWPDGRVEVEVSLENRSRRPLRSAEVSIRCHQGWTVPFGPVAPGGTGVTQVSLGVGKACEEGYRVQLAEAHW